MGKLKGILLSLILVVVAIPLFSVFSACEWGGRGQVNVTSVTLDRNSYTIAKDLSFTLAPTVAPANASNKKVVFSSSNEAIARVSNDGQVTGVSVGSAIISARTEQGGKTANCAVTVIAELISLAKPLQVVYDGAQLKWGAVSTGGDLGYVVSYQLRVNGVDREATTVQTSYSNFDTGIEYTVAVRAKGDNAKYSDSQYSDSVTFTKLASPAITNASKQDNKLIFDKVNGATSYELSVKYNSVALTGAEADMFTTVPFVVGSTQVEYAIPQDVPAGEYTFTVKALGNVSVNLYDSEFSGAVSITKLARPANAHIVGGLLTWKNVLGATGYVVTLSSGFSGVVNYALGASITSFTIPADYIAENAQFEARVQALGDGVTAISSAIEGPCATERLDAPTSLGISGTQLSWGAVANATHYGIRIGAASLEELAYGTSFDLAGKVPVGTVDIQIVAHGDNTHYVVSNPSSSLVLTKLGKPNNFRISGGSISWDRDYNASGFIIYINDRAVNLSGDATSYAMDYYIDDYDELKFFPSGNYSVKIKSIGNGSTIFDSEVFDLTDAQGVALVVIKLPAPENFRVDSGKIMWDSLPNAGSFMLEISKDDVVSEHVVQNAEASINALLELFSDGIYGFRIRALASASPYISGSYPTVGLVASKYATPDGLRVEDGVLTWNVNVASGDVPTLFRVMINNSVIETTSTNSILIRNSTQANVQLRVRVQAAYDGSLGGDTTLRLDSNYSQELVVVQLARPANALISSGIFSWNEVRDLLGNPIERYKVYIDYGGTAERVEEVYGATSFAVPFGDLAAGTHNIRVMACGDTGNILNSDVSLMVSFHVFANPRASEPNREIFVSNGVLTWSHMYYILNGTPVYASSYRVYVRNSQAATVAPTPRFEVTGNTCSLDALEPGIWYVSIVAVGNNTTTFSSPIPKAIHEFTIEKLAAPSSGFGTLDASFLWADESGKTSTYDVRLNKKQIDNSIISYGVTRVENSTQFTFSASHLGGLYQVSVRAVGDNGHYITSNYSSIVLVRRLASVTGLEVGSSIEMPSYVAWAPVAAEVGYFSGYSVIINGTRDTSSEYLDRKLDMNSSFAVTMGGSLKVQVVARYAAGVPIMEDGAPVYIMDSAPSAILNLYRNASPVLQVSNGLLEWMNYSNLMNFGVEIRFTEATGTLQEFRVIFGSEESNYDLSNVSGFTPQPGMSYRVSIRALGNGGTYIDSGWSADYEQPISKLAPPTTYTIISGNLSWSHITNATSYGISVVAPGNTYYQTVEYIGQGTLTYLPEGQAGSYEIKLRALGDDLRYISSAETGVRTFTKLDMPNVFRVENGEIEWNTRSVDGLRRLAAINGGTEVALPTQLHGFRVWIGEEIWFDVGIHEKFIMSQHPEFVGGSYSVRVAALGNSYTSGMPDANLALTSGYTTAMNVWLPDKVTNIGIVDGVFVWNAGDNYSDYELDWKYQDLLSNWITLTEEIMGGSSLLNFLTPTYSNGSAISYSIRVRNQGTAYGDRNSSFALMLNNAYSVWVDNVKKLPRPETFGIVNGALAWNFGTNYANYDAGYIPDVGVFVNDTRVASGTSLAGAGQFVLGSAFPAYTIEEDEQGNSFVGFFYYLYNMQVLGDSSSYVSSEPFEERGAYKFAQVDNVSMGPANLYVTWTGTNGELTVGGYRADKYLVNYKITNKAEVALDGTDDLVYTPKYVTSTTRRLSLWTLGTYSLEISALMTDDSMFRSDPVTQNNIVFDSFEKGNGTPDRPFVISDKTTTGGTIANGEIDRLNHIRHIPASYFRLGQNITLPSAGTSLNFNAIGSSAEPFTGGLDGDGYSIIGYNIGTDTGYGSQSTIAMFNEISGGYRSGFSAGSPGADSFGGRYGIVANLTMSSVRIKASGASARMAALALVNNGYIDNCTVSGEINANNYLQESSYAAGLVVNNGAAGFIMNSMNNMKITLSSNSMKGYVGGIAAENIGVIINCGNTAELQSNYAGGIVANNRGIALEVRGLVEASFNIGNIFGIADLNTAVGAQSSSTGPAGGIASMNAGDILLSYNWANITTVNNFAGSDPSHSVDAGGIVAQNLADGTVKNCYSSGVVARSGTYLSNAHLGGIIGNNSATSSTNFANCAYDSTVFAGNAVGTGMAVSGANRTTAQMQATLIVDTLNNGQPNKFKYNSGDYPLLYWQ